MEYRKANNRKHKTESVIPDLIWDPFLNIIWISQLADDNLLNVVVFLLKDGFGN
jgi:hypothetical protein